MAGAFGAGLFEAARLMRSTMGVLDLIGYTVRERGATGQSAHDMSRNLRYFCLT
jgi:hypothetical protein